MTVLPAITSLAELVAPLSVDDFNALLRERRVRHVRGAGHYASLLDWAGLMDAVVSGAYPSDKLRLTREGRPIPPLFYRTGDRPKPGIVEQVMDDGGSIVAYDIGPAVPALGALAGALADESGERIVVSAIATTGRGGALDLHYDETDIVILQVEGSKRWTFWSDPVIDPVLGMAREFEGPDATPALDLVLEAGDWLFVPAGHRHQCANTAERSLHLGFFFYPMTAPRALELLMEEMIASPADRKPLRFDRADAGETERALKARLIETIERTGLDDLLARHRA